MNPLETRLWEDYDNLTHFRSDVMTWEVIERDPNDLPMVYRVRYDVQSIVGWDGDIPTYDSGFVAIIDLHPPYPGYKAAVSLEGKVPWHPNIHPDGRVCYAAEYIKGIGLPLPGIVERIGMIIAYQLYTDIDRDEDPDPVRTDEGFWEQFRKNRELYPTDRRAIRLPDQKRSAPRFGAA